MLTNVLQKPVGALAVLTAAIGGPYAAFETDAGSMVRRVISGGMQQSPSSSDADPASLGLLNQQTAPSTNSAYYNAPNNYFPNGTSNNSAAAPNGYGNAAYNTPSQPNVIYGPATITPLGGYGVAPGMVPTPNGYGSYQAAPRNPYANLETRQGPAQVVPGGTQQLWDYTIGVPTLQQLQRQPTAVGGGNVQDLREVLRFDVTPIWLTQRFSRVTTVLSNVQLDGMRVPLITGTQTTDLAGTLTYYFDSRQSVRRINLHGLTGDPSQLANLMVQFYGLKPEQSLGGQLYTSRWNNQVNCVLQLSPAPIVYSGADHSKFVVFLELNQADSNMGLSPEASEILNNLQSIRRW